MKLSQYSVNIGVTVAEISFTNKTCLIKIQIRFNKILSKEELLVGYVMGKVLNKMHHEQVNII